MTKSFFLKRSFEIKLRETKQFVEISVGVMGEIDSASGMILNLAVLDAWFREFRFQIDSREFQNLIELLNTAKLFFQEKQDDLFAVQIDWQQGTALPMALRWQYEAFHLALKGSLKTAENFQISFLIKNAQELDLMIERYLKNQTEFSSSQAAAQYFENQSGIKISGIKTENPILQRAFVESLD